MCMSRSERAMCSIFLFFFNDTATTEIYTLSLHDALPICVHVDQQLVAGDAGVVDHDVHSRSYARASPLPQVRDERSEEHTSELQSRQYLVCRLLLEKKKKHYLQRFLTNFISHNTSSTR